MAGCARDSTLCVAFSRVMEKSRVLDRSTARVVLKMLARDMMSKGMVAELCETSISSIGRVRQSGSTQSATMALFETLSPARASSATIGGTSAATWACPAPCCLTV